VAAICVGAAAACGTAASGGGGAASSPPKVSLNITVTGVPGRASQHWTLTCDPTGGTHPNAAAACAELLRYKEPFAPLLQPKDLACPMILASSKVATIKGTYFGQPVNTTLHDGACDLSRWAQLGQVVN
jgi:hypothetical protein